MRQRDNIPKQLSFSSAAAQSIADVISELLYRYDFLEQAITCLSFGVYSKPTVKQVADYKKLTFICNVIHSYSVRWKTVSIFC